MSTEIFDVTVLAIDVEPARARIRFRLSPIASEGDRSVTRSFVIRLLACDGWLAPSGSPPVLVRLVQEAGLEPWPDPAETLRLHAPVVDRLVTSTRLVAEHPDDSYELEAELPDPRFVDGLHVGQTFSTYASDVWFEDPKHPLATAAKRHEWAAAQRAAIAQVRDKARAEVDREAEGVAEWLARVERAELLAVAPAKRKRVAARIASLIQSADDPGAASARVLDYLMSSDDIDEVFAEDRDLRESLASVLGA